MRSGTAAAWIAVLALAAGAGAFWTFGRYEVFPKRFVEIESGRLFRSGQIAPRLIRETLERHGIEVVIDLQQPGDDPPRRAEQDAIRALGIEYLRFPLGGSGTGDPRVYGRALAAIDAALRSGRPTLVHCAAGARRTGGVIAMYQLLVEGRDPAEVYRELDRYGRTPVGETRLLPFLNANAEGIARQLVELGVLDRVPDPVPRLGP